MGSRLVVGGLGLVLLLGLGSWGQGFLVCPQGCLYSSIQEAINDAFPGDTITVGPSTYQEHLEIREYERTSFMAVVTTSATALSPGL